MNKFAYVLLASIIICGCEKDGEVISTINSRYIKTYIIDECEYVGSVVGGNRDFLAHKGNCKFCAERNKRNCQ
jgi:hypothetical protein